MKTDFILDIHTLSAMCFSPLFPLALLRLLDLPFLLEVFKFLQEQHNAELWQHVQCSLKVIAT